MIKEKRDNLIEKSKVQELTEAISNSKSYKNAFSDDLLVSRGNFDLHSGGEGKKNMLGSKAS